MSVPYYGDFAEDDTVNIPFNTFSSDDPSKSCTITELADADIKVYKDGADTEIVTDGATVLINFDGHTGAHMITIDTSAHSDYTTGSEYAVLIDGTVIDAATDMDMWIGTFSIERAGGVLARLETLITTIGAAGIGLTAITDNTDEIGALGVGLTTCATATGFATPTNITAAAGCAVSSMGADVIDAASLKADAVTKIIDDFETQSQADPTGFHVNVMEVNETAQTAGDIGAVTNALTSAAAAKLALSAGAIVVGTVSHDNTAATTEVFYSNDIDTAATDHYNGRIVIFTSGLLQNQATDITAYALDTGEGKFTVTALTEAPADNVTFVIV